MGHARLLETAIREFGAKGLEGASTRGIAAAADTAMSSITYHYGGKDGLYIAAADYIASEMDDMEGDLGIADIVSSDDRNRARAAIHTVLSRFVDKMASSRSESWALFIAREQMNPTEAFDHIYDGPMGRMLQALVDLVCVATGHRSQETARMTVLTLFGQVMVVRAARATCCRLLEREPGEAAPLQAFHTRIARNTDAILDSLLSEQQGHA